MSDPLPDKPILDWFDRNGLDRPTHESHGEFDPANLIPFKATKWWCEGNILYAEGNHGVIANTIPTDYICKGMDANGLPILKKIVS